MLAAGMAALLVGAALVAQVGGERGIAPVAATNDIEVGGISVDVSRDNAQAARQEGWREAQRKAWAADRRATVSDRSFRVSSPPS
jgi:hypothetical protein